MEMVRKAHKSLREQPLQAIFPEGIRPDILFGMKFRVTNINFVTNTVIFTLVE
jgi:hypothetical protein